MVLGSTSVPQLLGPGQKLRWVALFVTALIAALLVVRDRPPQVGRPVLLVGGLGAWLVVLGVVSTFWSVDPRLTFERAVSFGLLLLTASGLALASHTRPGLPSRLLVGMLGGAVAAAVGGVLLLGFAHGEAVQPASLEYPARFQGLGQNPDTAAMLEGFVFPIALWACVRARTRSTRLVALASALLLLGSIAASGSRGGLLAALVGGVVYSFGLPGSVRRRLAAAAAAVIAVLGATAVSQIPKPLSSAPQATAPTTSAKPAKAPPPTAVGGPVGGPEQQYGGPLGDELFRYNAGQRSLFTSSGRLQAWWEALKQAMNRPVLGYGFGTEEKVFIDRVYNFNGGHVENSFVGMFLQLGIVGLVSLVALVLAILRTAWVAVRRLRFDSLTAPLAALAVSGIPLMGVQSYAYAVGNIVTASFWIATLVLAATASTVGGTRRVVEPAIGGDSVVVSP